jgi:hypothetical protein
MRAITDPVSGSDDPHEHRLGDNFCFLKLCKGEVADPFSGELSLGMYVPLDLWDKLTASGKLQGPRGGSWSASILSTGTSPTRSSSPL